jgi:SagB-type dehydrogenase family enzyme
VLNRTTKIKLIEPRQTGTVSVEQCISQRRSVRGFGSQSLTEQQLGQLLWAAQGITTAEGKRTVSSASALYPLQLYAACSKVSALTGGVYRYDPGHHELLLVSPGRQCEKLFDAARGQEWIASAPAVICIAADFERTMSKYGARGRGYVYMETGQAAESLMLQAVALGLASTIVGAFGDEDVKHLLHLALNETPLCLLPVGVP